MSDAYATRKDPNSERLARDQPETNPMPIKPETVSHVAEQFTWVPLPFCSLPGSLFPIVFCFISMCVSLDNLFPIVRQEPPLRPWRSLPSCNKVTFGKSLRIGAGCQGNQTRDYRVWTFSPIPPTSGEGREGRLEIKFSYNDQSFNQSCLCSKATIKTPKGQMGFRELMCWWIHTDSVRGTEALSPFPCTLHCVTFPSGCFWIISCF